MLHASPGFITLALTPSLGTIDMLGEDAADRYAIMGLEKSIHQSATDYHLRPGHS